MAFTQPKEMKDRLRQQHHVGEGQIDFQLCGAVLSPSGQKLSPSFFFFFFHVCFNSATLFFPEILVGLHTTRIIKDSLI